MLPYSHIRATSVDAPFLARGNFRIVVARGRMLPSVDAPFLARGNFRIVVARGRMLPSVDAPFLARGNFRIVVARGRMLPSVRPLVRQRTAAGLYGSSRTGSKSQPRTRGTVLHTGYPDPVSPTVAPCRPSARPTPSRPRRAYAAGAGAR